MPTPLEILQTSLDAAFSVEEAASQGEFLFKYEKTMVDYALIYDAIDNQNCNVVLDIELPSCSRNFEFDEEYPFDVQTIEDDQTMYRAGFYDLTYGGGRAVPTTFAEIVNDVVTYNSGNYSEIVGGRATAFKNGGISITHNQNGQIASHVFIVAAGLISGVKDITGTALTSIDLVFTNVSMTILGVDTTVWDIYVINRVIAPGTYRYAMY